MRSYLVSLTIVSGFFASNDLTLSFCFVLRMPKYLILTNLFKEMELSSMDGKDWQELVQDVLGYDPLHCKKCNKGRMVIHERIDAKPRAA
jgi:hypothetical protein